MARRRRWAACGSGRGPRQAP